MNSDIFSQVSRLGFNVTREWLEACIEFCQSQDDKLSGQGLVNAVRQQWLNSDITSEGIQANPQIKADLQPDVAKGPMLQGRFCVQVQRAIDIGQNSAYSQLQTALKIRNENTLVSADIDTQRPLTAAWEPKSKRMLKLVVSDGLKSYPALEFEPINQLSYPVTPGLKLELNGPIQVRRGVLLLKPSNVKVLGGEATDLKETCSLVHQLMQALGQDNAALLNGGINQRPVQSSAGNRRPDQTSVGNQRPVQNSAGNQRPVQNSAGNQRPVQNSAVASDNNAVFDDDDDEIFNAIPDLPITINTSRPPNLSWNRKPTSGGKVPALAPNQPQVASSTKSSFQNQSKNQPGKKEKATAPKKEHRPRKAPTKQFQTPNFRAEAASVWDDDGDEALLLCAEAVDQSFKHKASSQKRVPKLPQYTPDLLLPKKAKVEPSNSMQDEDPFPDDDALFCELDSPLIKKEILASQNVPRKIVPWIKVEPKFEPVSQPVQLSSAGLSNNILASKTMPNVSPQGTACIPSSSLSSYSKPYIYFVNVDRTSDVVEIIKGCIASLASKLQVVETAAGRVWNVKVLVTDGLETLTAKLSPVLIAEAFGFSPQEYAGMAQDKKATMKEASSKLSSKLGNFNGLLKISFRAHDPEPEIIEMIAMNRGHLQQLKNRLQRESH